MYGRDQELRVFSITSNEIRHMYDAKAKAIAAVFTEIGARFEPRSDAERGRLARRLDDLDGLLRTTVFLRDHVPGVDSRFEATEQQVRELLGDVDVEGLTYERQRPSTDAEWQGECGPSIGGLAGWVGERLVARGVLKDALNAQQAEKPAP